MTIFVVTGTVARGGAIFTRDFEHFTNEAAANECKARFEANSARQTLFKATYEVREVRVHESLADMDSFFKSIIDELEKDAIPAIDLE